MKMSMMTMSWVRTHDEDGGDTLKALFTLSKIRSKFGPYRAKKYPVL